MSKPEQKPVNRLHAELRAANRILAIVAEFPEKAKRRILANVVDIIEDRDITRPSDGGGFVHGEGFPP